MNQTFSFKRFSLLFKKHTVENFKSYLMSLIVLVSILIIIIEVTTYKKPIPLDAQTIFFLIFLISSGTIFTSNVFINLSDKRRAIATIMLPSSSFEKFMIGWIYSFIIFQALFIGVFYGVITLLLKISWPAKEDAIFNAFDFNKGLTFAYVTYAVLNSITLYGAVFFKKMHFIKTAFALFISVMIVWLLNLQVLRSIFKKDISNPPFTGLNFPTYKNSYTSIDVDKTWVVAVFLLLAVIIWMSAYYRLKEKQV